MHVARGSELVLASDRIEVHTMERANDIALIAPAPFEASPLMWADVQKRSKNAVKAQRQASAFIERYKPLVRALGFSALSGLVQPRALMPRRLT